jgi:hypothetical protein
MTAAESATTKYGAAAEAAAVKDRATASTDTAASAPAATAAMMATANFSDQFVGDGVRGRRRAWIDRRQCFCAVA